MAAGGGSSRVTMREGDRFRARDEMPSTEGLDIYASPFSLFVKLTKLQTLIAKLLDMCFLDFFFINI